MQQREERGYTLVELVIVVTVLAIIAAIAVPSSREGTDKQLELAAAEFASAIRFARTEAIRTGEPHGFRFLTNQYRIRVFTVDTSATPWTWVFDVYHPVDKQLYDYRFPTSLTGAVTPVTHNPLFRGTCTTQGVLYFDGHGAPWCLQPETVAVESYRLDLDTGMHQASVHLDGITGRVTVQ